MCFDRVAVRAQRDHLHWVIRTAKGQIVDVVDFQDRGSAIGHVMDVAGAVGVLAPSLAAQQDCLPRGR